MKIHGAIFDMDGTLIDSMYVWKDIGSRYLRYLGYEPPENLNEAISNMSMQQVCDYFTQTIGLARTPRQISEEINAMVEPIYENEIGLKAGVATLLEKLSSMGVKMCVATATDMHIVEAVLKNCGIRHYFSEIFTCTSVGAGKDNPLIYERALELLGTEKKYTPVFEDALYAAKTAKAAGFPVIGIYDSYSASEQEKIKALSDCYITDYSSEIDSILA